MSLLQPRAAAIVLLMLATMVAGCASDRLHREGITLMEQGQEQAGLAKLEEAVRNDPGNGKYRADLLTARSDITERLLREGQQAQAAGREDEALQKYRQALVIDSRNELALTGILSVERDRRHRQAVAEAEELEKQGDLDAAEPIVRAVLAENPGNGKAAALRDRIEQQRLAEIRATPVLKPKVAKPVTLEFRDANLKLVFDALSRTSGINFLLDKDVKKDTKITVALRNVRVEDAIELIAIQNELSSKVLSENSVLVYPRQKNREYQDLMVKSFYLDNAKVKETVEMLKTVLKTKDVYIDESLNLVIMRDTPEAVRLAEKLVIAQDMAEPEVMLEMEVIEVNRSRLLELGIQWTDQYTFGVVDPTGPPFTLDDLKGINHSRITVTRPSATATLRKTDGDSNALLSPRIRVHNREKARVVVADRLPVISAVVSTGTGNPVVTDSIQYLDVGLKLEVQPVIHLDNMVTISVKLEVSNLGEEVRTANGSVAYRTGTRNAQTVLRMADGETQILSGVIRDEERKAATKIPGLGDLPVLGRLFGTHSDENRNTEILLAITPRIISNVVRPQAQIAEFWSGSELTLRTRPLTLRTVAAESGLNNNGAIPAIEPESAAPEPSQSMREPLIAPIMAAPRQGQVTALFKGPEQAKVGETFDVWLWVNAAEPVNAMAAQLGFDPAVLEAVKVSEGDFLNRDGTATAFTHRIDPSGRVLLRNVRGVAGGVAGDGLLAKVTFRAKDASAEAQIKLLTLVSMGANRQALSLAPLEPLALVLRP
ncbi:MAG: general secretion pathway protein GspD [Betaproteobacteria bacterium]|nr:MAG: general secretion pathway protein GspD [Betaproteobacteria bacterium]